MTDAPLRRCLEPGCRERVVSGRCPAHERKHDRHRGSARERGYDAKWDRTSKWHLRRYPLCGMRAPEAFQDGWRGECFEQKRTTAASCTDHIRPHHGDMVLFWDPRNRQSLCFRCNTLKSQRFE